MQNCLVGIIVVTTVILQLEFFLMASWPSPTLFSPKPFSAQTSKINLIYRSYPESKNFLLDRGNIINKNLDSLELSNSSQHLAVINHQSALQAKSSDQKNYSTANKAEGNMDRHSRNGNTLKMITSEHFSINDTASITCYPQWKCVRSVYFVPNDSQQYFVSLPNKLFCFIEGTNLTMTYGFRIDENTEEINRHHFSADSTCVCFPGWSGSSCSIPEVIQVSNLFKSLPLTIRNNNPRRIINAFPFSEDFDMLEARFTELADVIDVFLILESNYSAYGDAKRLKLRDKLVNNAYPKVLGDHYIINLNYWFALHK